MVLRGLELRARHAVLSNRSLRGRTAAVHPQKQTSGRWFGRPLSANSVQQLPSASINFSSRVGPTSTLKKLSCDAWPVHPLGQKLIALLFHSWQIKEIDQPQRHERGIGNQEQHEDQGCDEINIKLGHFPDIGLGNRARDHEHAGHRRCRLGRPRC